MDTTIQNTDLGNEALLDEAYARVKPDLDALQVEELIQVNLDVTAAVTSSLGLLPEVRALREEMVKALPTFDIAAFDKLEDYALALSFTNTGYLAATLPPDDLDQLNVDATKLHDRMLADAQALVQHGLLNGAQLAQLKGGNGYKSLAQDLQLLGRVMRQEWDKIANRSGTTAEDLKAAYQMSVRLMRVVGVREQGPAVIAQATDQRLRAFTKLINVYEDTRRAVYFLRGREGDADTISPSLYPGRPRKRGTDPGVTEPTTPTSGAGKVAPAPSAGSASEPATAAAASSAEPTDGDGASKHPFLS